MAKAKLAKYTVEADSIFFSSSSHKTAGFFSIVPEELDFFFANNPEVTKLHIGARTETAYFSCDWESLKQLIEDHNFDSENASDGLETFLVPVATSIFTKRGGAVSSASNSEDSWLKVRRKLVEESGGFWSASKMKAWKNKFSGAANPINKPLMGRYAIAAMK